MGVLGGTKNARIKILRPQKGWETRTFIKKGLFRWVFLRGPFVPIINYFLSLPSKAWPMTKTRKAFNTCCLSNREYVIHFSIKIHWGENFYDLVCSLCWLPHQQLDVASLGKHKFPGNSSAPTSGCTRSYLTCCVFWIR